MVYVDRLKLLVSVLRALPDEVWFVGRLVTAADLQRIVRVCHAMVAGLLPRGEAALRTDVVALWALDVLAVVARKLDAWYGLFLSSEVLTSGSVSILPTAVLYMPQLASALGGDANLIAALQGVALPGTISRAWFRVSYCCCRCRAECFCFCAVFVPPRTVSCAHFSQSSTVLCRRRSSRSWSRRIACPLCGMLSLLYH